MEKVIETTGKTIEDAISSALSQLGVERDAVSVEVLEKPKPGFLGLGGTPAKIRVSFSESRLERTAGFLRELLSRMDIFARTEESEDADGNIAINLTGDNMGILIGRRGDTLEALQHVSGYIANKSEETNVRVTVDTEGYRAKREEALVSLAKKMAAKAVKYRRNMVLEPMNSYARHVIHSALQDSPDVTTKSTGVEPNRRVVITVPGGDKPTKSRPFNPQPYSGGSRPPRPGGQRRPGESRFR